MEIQLGYGDTDLAAGWTAGMCDEVSKDFSQYSPQQRRKKLASIESLRQKLQHCLWQLSWHCSLL